MYQIYYVCEATEFLFNDIIISTKEVIILTNILISQSTNKIFNPLC